MFSQTAEYALRSMAWLAMSPGTLVPTGDLARATKVPPHYLAKVLQQMAAARLITGRRGVGGGYRLAGDPREITLKDVVNAVTPIERIASCPIESSQNGGGGLCPLHSVIDSIAASVLKTLENTTLADLLSRPGHPQPLCGDGAANVAVAASAPTLAVAAASNGSLPR